MKVKGVDVSKLTKSQQNAMKKHSKHHTKDTMVLLSEKLKHTFLLEQKMAKLKK